MNGADLDAAAVELLGRPLGLTDVDLSEVLDPRHIVETRQAQGGASPEIVAAMAKARHRDAAELRTEIGRLLADYDRAEADVLDQARAVARG